METNDESLMWAEQTKPKITIEYVPVFQTRVVFIIVSVEERLQHPHVFGVADAPVEGREVLALGKFLVQTPENLT